MPSKLSNYRDTAVQGKNTLPLITAAERRANPHGPDIVLGSTDGHSIRKQWKQMAEYKC